MKQIVSRLIKASPALTIEIKPVTGRKDWFAYPGRYAPDGLSDYANEMKA